LCSATFVVSWGKLFIRQLVLFKGKTSNRDSSLTLKVGHKHLHSEPNFLYERVNKVVTAHIQWYRLFLICVLTFWLASLRNSLQMPHAHLYSNYNCLEDPCTLQSNTQLVARTDCTAMQCRVIHSTFPSAVDSLSLIFGCLSYASRWPLLIPFFHHHIIIIIIIIMKVSII
jgi:hypothetical protein